MTEQTAKSAAGGAETKVAQEKANKVKAMHQFPKDLGDVYMLLNFYDYDFSRAKGSPRTQGDIKTSIALPMPTSLVDSSRLEVGGKQLGILGGVAGDVASGSFSVGGFGQGVIDAVKNISSSGESFGASVVSGDFNAALDSIGQAVSGIGNAGLYLLRAGVGAIAPQVEQGIGSALGTAVNPHATLVFDGVDLKIHNFEWQFAPKSIDEQNELDRIINRIKFHIHPEYANPLGDVTTSGLASVDRGLLKYPSLVEVSLIGVSGSMQMMFKSDKLMMVNQFNVDFTPTGNVELNRGGTPVMTRCSMNLSESMIYTRKDFGVLNNNAGSTGTGNDAEASRASADDTTEGSASRAGSVSSAPNGATVAPGLALNTTTAVDNGNRVA